MKIHNAAFEAAATKIAEIPPSRRPEIALAGRSNVGKSSLVNMLAGRKSLARTSRTPGCTRGLIFFSLNDELTLVDLPGYGYAERSHGEREGWRRLVDHYLSEREALAGVLMLFDIRRGPQPEELALAAFLQERDCPAAFAVTKCDKLPRSKASSALAGFRRQLAPIPVLGTSAKKGEGRREVWDWLRAPAPPIEEPTEQEPGDFDA
jgi:GTP-binding protein